MLSLHGTWLRSDPFDKTRGFILWAETDRPPEMSMRAGARQHPFAASSRALRHTLQEWIPSADSLWRAAADFRATAWLPSIQDTPTASSPLLQARDENSSPSLQLAAWQVDALRVEPQRVPAFLAALPSELGARSGCETNLNPREKAQARSETCAARGGCSFRTSAHSFLDSRRFAPRFPGPHPRRRHSCRARTTVGRAGFLARQAKHERIVHAGVTADYRGGARVVA